MDRKRGNAELLLSLKKVGSVVVSLGALMKRCRNLLALIAVVAAVAISVPALAAGDTALFERAAGAEAAVLAELPQLVNIDSPAEHAIGLNQIRDSCQRS